MSYLDTYTKTQNVWESWRNARDFPKLIAKSDYTILLVLGQHDFGYTVGSRNRGLSSTPLNLTGASVRVVARRVASYPTAAEQAQGITSVGGAELFDVEAEITDADDGECSVELTPENTDGVGDFLGEIEVTDADGKVFVPGQFRLQLLEKLGV